MERTEWQAEGPPIMNKKELRQYMNRNDWRGLVHLSGHVSALGATGYGLYVLQWSWWAVPLVVLHGALIAFLFAPMHECVHNTAFRTRRLNEIVGRFGGLMILRPFLYLKYRHMAHHTFTRHPEKDPDNVPFPRDFKEYFLYVTGYNVWHRLISTLVQHAIGRFSEQERAFIPANEIPRVVREARIMMALYASIAAASLLLQTWLAVYLWLAPRVVGESVLRTFRMAEHTGMEESPSMLRNTRTTISNPIVRAMYWNMPYHVEHHLYPSVPFHQLPELHKQVGPHAKEVASGFTRVHLQIVRDVWNREKAKRQADTDAKLAS